MGGRARRAVCAAAVWALGCGAGLFDLGALEERHAGLRGVAGHRLADARPYLLPSRGVLTLFLCRWDAALPIRVALPDDAEPRQRRAIEAALSAWEGAGLGIRFEREPSGAGDLEIGFATPDARLARAADAVADCALAPAALADGATDVLPARLVHASIRVARFEVDPVGREIPHSPEELAGSLLHELGHALGFQGHARRGATVMVRSVDAVRRAGRRVLAGRGFEDPTLRALYRVPSGAVVRRVALAPGQTRLFDALARVARRRDFDGPYLRVGDRAARLAWLEPSGRSHPLLIPRVGEALRSPERLEITALRRTRELLEGAGAAGRPSTDRGVELAGAPRQ